MNNIFGKEEVKVHPSETTCHTGGAIGSDTVWEELISNHGGDVRAYSYKTKYHNSVNKVEISDEDFEEGSVQVVKANKYLKRYRIDRHMNLLARNWAQVKYSDQIIAIGRIVWKGDKNYRGYKNKGEYPVVDGGTGFAVMMGILNSKEVYVFDQTEDQWYKWSYKVGGYVEIDREDVFIKYKNFAGIGTRDINREGLRAIKDVLENSIE